MQDVNRLKIVLVELKKGEIHDVDNIVEGTAANGYLNNWGAIHLPFQNGVPTLHSQISKPLLKFLSSLMLE